MSPYYAPFGAISLFFKFVFILDRDHMPLGNNYECMKTYNVKISVPPPVPQPSRPLPQAIAVPSSYMSRPPSHWVFSLCVCVWTNPSREVLSMYTHTCPPVPTIFSFFYTNSAPCIILRLLHLALFMSQYISVISAHQHTENSLTAFNNCLAPVVCTYLNTLTSGAAMNAPV